jgi:hypothetical protein
MKRQRRGAAAGRWLGVAFGAVLIASSGCSSDDPEGGSGGSAGSGLAAGAGGRAAASGGTAELGGSSSKGGAPSNASGGTGGTSGTSGGTTAGSGASAGGADDGSGGDGQAGAVSAVGGSAGAVDPGEGGSSGAAPVDAITDTVVIVPDDRGFVAPESNGIGIRGNWSTENDCSTSPDDCTADHVIGPRGGEVPFETRPYPTTGGEVCLRATTASVNEESEYDAKWGVKLILPLNEGPNGEFYPYDAAARGIGAFAVSVKLRGGSMVNSSIRVALRVDGVEGAHSRQFYDLTSDGSFTAEFKRVKQGNWDEPFSVFDPSRITAIEVTLPTRMGYALPLDLCITRVLAIPAAIYEPDLSADPELPAGTHLVPLRTTGEGTLLSNDAGLEGGWFSENDCETSPDDCTADHTPAPGDTFVMDGDRACTSGIVDPVGASSEYATKWGAAIGLYLNRPDPAEEPGAYDAPAHGVVGFAYKLRTYNIEPIRAEAISVGVAEPHFYEVTQAGVTSLRFSYLIQGDWVTERTPLDPSQLTALRFHVPSASGVVRNFDFCVEELSAIVED